MDELVNKGIIELNSSNKNKHHSRIVVVGTARGGTSMIAGVLSNLGIFMGDLSTSPVFEDLRLSGAFEQKDTSRIKKIVRDYNKNHTIWGWKRPSSINDLDLVEKSLDKPLYIFVYKDIMSIANRNSISMLSDITPGMQKALDDYQSSITFLRETKPHALLVSYEKVMNNTSSLIDALVKYCRINPTHSQLQKAHEFISVEPKEYLDKSRITKAEGEFHGIIDGKVTGWAKYVHSSIPSKTSVVIYLNEKIIFTLLANKPRPGLEEWPEHNCAFSESLPAEISISSSDILRARVVNEVRDLTGSPLKLSTKNTALSQKWNNKVNRLLICPGLPRTGTTYLYKQLVARNKEHFNPSKRKEMHFFLSDNNFEKYIETFSEKSEDRIYIDSSPLYMNRPDAIDRICDLPSTMDVKIIIGIRHPVDQAFSHYTHDLKAHVSKFQTPELNGSFFSDAAISKYFIKRYENYKKLIDRFGFENILALNFHKDIGSSTLNHKLEKFLGIKELHFASERVNQGMWVPYYLYASNKPQLITHAGVNRILKPKQLLLVNGSDSCLWNDVTEKKAKEAILASATWTKRLDVSSLEMLYSTVFKEDFEKTLNLLKLSAEEFTIPNHLNTNLPVIDSQVFQELELHSKLSPYLSKKA